MIEDVLPKVADIFVGREPELRRLNGFWKLARKEGEHLVYVLLNAPGVGKTTLINYFGKSIEEKGKGLFIRLRCSKNADTPFRIKNEILHSIQKVLKQKINVIRAYWNKKKNEIDIKEEENELQNIKRKISNLLHKAELDIYDVYEVFNDLSAIIPIFFAADEIQEYQQIRFSNVTNGFEEETGLHFFTRILKDLLDLKVLVILSGTRYHILSQIGAEIGSPIRQKVDPIVIQKFNENEVKAYVKQVEEIIRAEVSEKDVETLQVIVRNYEMFLFAFSGGHPRTIEKITNMLLSSLSSLLSRDESRNYESFINYLLPKVEEFFSNSLLSSVHKQGLINLTSSEAFSVVKEWILDRGSGGLSLEKRPKSLESPQLDDEIKRIAYELMNIGIIVQNGDYNYHLTSYFHFLEFLNLYNEPYEQFLREVLHNKYFKLMCGFHSGFGYAFENVFFMALIIKGSEIEKKMQMPINLKQLKNLEPLKGKVKWTEIDITPNVLYHTPTAGGIDGFLFQEDTLTLLQLTTGNPPDALKIDTLFSEMKAISGVKLKAGAKIKVQGWFVSLFDLKKEAPSRENLLFTAGSQLIPLLGEKLLNKLRIVKQSFNNAN